MDTRSSWDEAFEFSLNPHIFSILQHREEYQKFYKMALPVSVCVTALWQITHIATFDKNCPQQNQTQKISLLPFPPHRISSMINVYGGSTDRLTEFFCPLPITRFKPMGLHELKTGRNLLRCNENLLPVPSSHFVISRFDCNSFE